MCFTEEQKQKIEAMGLKVIEFKRIIYNLGKVLCEVVEKVVDALLEFARKIADALMPAIEGLGDLIRDIQKSAAKVTHTRHYTMVRTYSKCKPQNKDLVWKVNGRARNRL